MNRNTSTILPALLLASALSLGAQRAAAQQKPGPAPAPVPAPRPDLEVGQMAPDFTLPGATRYGVLRDSVRLSSFKGQTVVLAFFYKARTKG